ncbi:probable protein phosphatase CG10417 [Episyrphus balteatus]|uniref:probable protein phosphatase CG10417 n=1 Tax=Episyrphus balteatus TaxID=286459 RepID=UPI002485FF3A|nr:probable protein phosphatase CG10417 [Episyrphus balteatus]
MGAYLSEPKVEKFSTDEMSDFLSVGASSMQGWRNSQEDAHNSILNFDKNTSFFAVYDGHGGAEVAAHCADKLPAFLKNLEAYKNGDFDLALKNAFLGFDATLLEDDVIQILKILAGERNVDVDDSEGAEDDDAEVENLAELREEGNLPLDAVLEKYKGVATPAAAVAPSMPSIKKLIDGPSGSKPQSPFLRGRRRQENDESASCSSKAKEEEETPETTTTTTTTTSPQNSKMEVDVDSTVSSSSSNQIKESSDKKASITANGSTTVTCSPDSSVKVAAAAAKESIQNGSVTSGKPVASEGVSSSDAAASNEASPVASSVKQQNGEVSSPSQACDASPATSSEKCPAVALNRAAKKIANSGISSTDMDDDSSCDSDADFQAEENSSTDEETRGVGFGSDDEDDEEDEEEDEEEEDEDDEEDALANEKFCANMIEEPGKDSGCTAVVALLHGRDLYVANAGDSRCVVCRKGKAIEMSLDHKPEDELESNRITKAGGRVTLDGRVNGGLNLSRAIGDHAYKMNSDLLPEEQMISALPDVKKLIIDKDDEFMILACDGIWNFMSSEEVVQFVRERLQDANKKVSEVCEELFDKCLAPNTLGDGTGCDNMTAVIVRFKDQLLGMPTKLKEEETEPVLLAKQIAESDAADVSLQQSLKRSASPSSADNTCDSENSNKRLKTEDEAAASNVAECDSGTSSSTSSSTSSAATSSTAAASTTGSTSSTT